MFFEIFQNEFTSFGKYDYGCHLVVVCLRSIDSYKLLSEVKEITEELKSMTEEEKKEQNILIEKKIDEYEAALLKEIEQYGHIGKGWNFCNRTWEDTKDENSFLE